MPLGEFSIIFLGDIWRKSQNEQGGKTEQKSGLRCGKVLCRNEGCLAMVRSRAKKATLGFAAAKPCFVTVKTLFIVGQNFYFIFQKSCIRTLIV